MSMNFRDKAVFRINRDEVGDCTISIRVPFLIIFHRWIDFTRESMHFAECLDIIKDWCCNRDIGKAVIIDPDGANPVMSIQYRRYKGEVLNELKQ